MHFLRISSLADGLSFIILLYYSIYEKRILGNEDAIRIPGMIHGVIFCIFCYALYRTWEKRNWKFSRPALIFLCALIPTAPFFLEASLKKEAQEKP